MEILAQTEEQTIESAAQLAERVAPGDVIFLQGNLGAGKSVFARSLIRTLMNDPDLDVPSPTFTLVQSYDTRRGPLWHFDLYRLKDPEEIYELGWEEALGEAIIVVEWPERLGPLKPAQYLDIRLESVENDPAARKIHITAIE